MTGKKRAAIEKDETELSVKRPSSTILGISRSISACQRCRIKKIRCDQNFPKCSKCDKAQVDCVGLDPATGREVPRSYVIHLEDRIALLETKLKNHGIDPDSDEAPASSDNGSESKMNRGSILGSIKEEEKDENLSPNQLADSGMKNNNIEHNTPSSYIGSTSGISFAKLMFTAVKLQNSASNSNTNHESTPVDPSTPRRLTNTWPALLPPKTTAQEFVRVYFAQSNSQLPVLHREEFLRKIFIPIYGHIDSNVSLASNYTAMNQSVFDIKIKEEDTWYYQYKNEVQKELQKLKSEGKSIDPLKISNSLVVPQKFHIPLYFLNMVLAIASSVHHLQYPSTISYSFKAAAIKYIDSMYSSPDKLESLQGILLLTMYSIMRPAVPGVWYVLGSALRVCVDIGLHLETKTRDMDAFTKDLRRRLFWCTYSLDRQICVYLGRPFGIPEESINTSFPTELDDTLIIRNDFSTSDYSDNVSGMPTYKVVSLSMFKIRQLQAEVQRILYERTELPRRFDNLYHWKLDISKRLRIWKLNSPKTQRKMNCDFNLEFFRLNFNHTLLMLHGLSPKNLKLSLDDFNIVSEAAKEVINAYNQLHLDKRINYTWVAVHNLFMSGTSYLYAIYNSEEVRLKNSIHEVKKISQICINVLNCLIDRCDAAMSCRDTFETLTAAVIKLRYNESVSGTIGFVNSQQIDKTQTGGHLASNLENLVQDINEETNNMIQTQKQYFNQAQQYPSNNDPFQFDQNYQSNIPVLPPSQQSINNTYDSFSKFEWTSNNENDLDHFFHELQNLSPISSYKDGEPQSLNVPKLPNDVYGRQVSGLSSGSSSSPTSLDNDNSLKYSSNNVVDSMDASSSSSIKIDSQNNKLNQLDLNKTYPSTKDGQKVFEMIYQVPAESIWDQFFATSFPGNNSMVAADFSSWNDYANVTDYRNPGIENNPQMNNNNNNNNTYNATGNGVNNNFNGN